MKKEEIKELVKGDMKRYKEGKKEETKEKGSKMKALKNCCK